MPIVGIDLANMLVERVIDQAVDKLRLIQYKSKINLLKFILTKSPLTNYRKRDPTRVFRTPRRNNGFRFIGDKGRLHI